MDLLIKQILDDKVIEYEITESLLFELFKKIRNTSVEDKVWGRLVLIYKTPLPGEIVNDLIDRKVSIIELGHSKQDYDVMWRLAELVEEALLTLAIDIYTNVYFGEEETKKLFDKFNNNLWMMETLAYKIPSSKKKEFLYKNAIDKSNEKERLLKLIRVLEETDRAGNPDLTIEEILNLYKTNQPKVLLSLSSNPITPVEILQELQKVSGTKFSKQIRHQAKQNLEKR